jgi:hypothetical protein
MPLRRIGVLVKAAGFLGTHGSRYCRPTPKDPRRDIVVRPGTEQADSKSASRNHAPPSFAEAVHDRLVDGPRQIGPDLGDLGLHSVERADVAVTVFTHLIPAAETKT